MLTHTGTQMAILILSHRLGTLRYQQHTAFSSPSTARKNDIIPQRCADIMALSAFSGHSMALLLTDIEMLQLQKTKSLLTSASYFLTSVEARCVIFKTHSFLSCVNDYRLVWVFKRWSQTQTINWVSCFIFKQQAERTEIKQKMAGGKEWRWSMCCLNVAQEPMMVHSILLLLKQEGLLVSAGH